MRIKPNSPATPGSATSVAEGPASASPNAAAAKANASAPDAGAAVFEPAVHKTAAASDATPAGPQTVAERFYDAFVNRRFDEMESLYDKDVTFKDDVFRYSDRKGTMGMWRKLLKDPGSVKASYRFERVEGDVAIGRWQADYKILGRKVHNDIESRLTIKDGKIVAHKDDFDFAKWAGQAFPIGPLAKLPGVQPLLSGLIRMFAG